MLPLITARSVEIVTDQSHVAIATKGVDLIPSQDRVTNALYYMPTIRYRPPWHLGTDGQLQFMLGGLVLTTPKKFAHAYYSFENGGVATNYLGAQTPSNYLGTEILVGVHCTVWPWKDHTALQFRLEQATFFPGSALEYPNGDLPDIAWKIMATTVLAWQ
jgi:hypothetical protein